MMPSVRLVRFTSERLDAVEAWFDKAETQKWLGGREWIRREITLLDRPIAEEFRGMITTGRHMWVSLDVHGIPVGYVDGETYDRYAAWNGTDPSHPIITEVVKTPSMGLGLVVDPARRGQGFGVRTVQAVLDQQEVAHIRLFFAGIDRDNLASRRCFERAGFIERSRDPDFEGILYYSFSRTA